MGNAVFIPHTQLSTQELEGQINCKNYIKAFNFHLLPGVFLSFCCCSVVCVKLPELFLKLCVVVGVEVDGTAAVGKRLTVKSGFEMTGAVNRNMRDAHFTKLICTK